MYRRFITKKIAEEKKKRKNCQGGRDDGELWGKYIARNLFYYLLLVEIIIYLRNTLINT